MRHNPHYDLMASMISTSDEIEKFLDLPEVLSMKVSKTTNKFLDLLKIALQNKSLVLIRLTPFCASKTRLQATLRFRRNALEPSQIDR
jgi:hypothetical protein